jgi:hypothetical protein
LAVLIFGGVAAPLAARLEAAGRGERARTLVSVILFTAVKRRRQARRCWLYFAARVPTSMWPFCSMGSGEPTSCYSSNSAFL